MKEPRLSLCHPPTNANRPLKQEVDEQEPSSMQPQNQDHAEQPYILLLPDHIILEIFSRIPILNMSRCRFVCKSWLRLFSDPSFTKTLCCRTPTSLVVDARGAGDYWVGLDEASRPTGDLLKLPTYKRAVMGSCHGFLLVFDCSHDLRRLYLCNPITGESFALPEYDAGSRIMGFGFSPVSNVFKVFLFSSDEIFKFDEYNIWMDRYNEEDVIVLTVGSSVWRNIGKYSVCFRDPDDYGLYFNGCLHWVGNDYKLVWGFDVEREVFQQFPPLPSTSGNTILYDSRLAVLRDSLCFIVARRITWGGQILNVWVMKDHGVQGSWSKEFEIVDEYFDRFVPHVLKFTEDGQLLLLRDYHLETHSPGKRGFSRFQVDGIPERVYNVYVHTPSFISLR